MNFDPELKKAIMEIEAVMRRYDIGGAISLTSKTHGEYLLILDPTWSVITQARTSDGFQVRIRSLQKEFESKEAQRKANELTSHLIFSQRDVAALTLAQLGKIEDILKSKWVIDHKVVELEKTEHNA